MQFLVRARTFAAALVVGAGVVGGVAPQLGSTSVRAQTAAKPPAANDEVVQLRRRVEQLEEQLVDIQVVLGTLETMARSGGGAPAQLPANGGALSGSGATGGDDVRIAALETQMRALTAQVQQLSRRDAQPGGAQIQGWSAGAAQNTVTAPAAAGSTGLAGSAPGSGFGSTTVQPRRNEGIGNLIKQDRTAVASNRTGQPGIGGGDPQQEYESAYGLLLQQNYGGAQAAFSDFVSKHPRHALAGNAQYWLGETFYVRGQYKSAAGAFLTGYRKFSASAKAPDSLLKLAMSLDRLGQRGAACSSLGELSTKFPGAAAHVKRRASQERSRLRC